MPEPPLRFRGQFPQALAVRFVQAVREETKAFGRLKELCLKGATNAHVWALSYGQEDTWLEETGNATLEAWRKYPSSLEALIPYQHFVAINVGELDQRVDIGSITLEWGQPWFNFSKARQAMHQKVDEEFDQIEAANRSDPPAYGSMDLDRDLKYAALYIFERRSYSDLTKVPGAHQDRTVINRAVVRLLNTLGLKARKAGRPRKAAREAGAFRH